MKSYFILNRQGEFNPTDMTNNQCKGWGHGKYFYLLQLVFDGTLKLDDNAFIIDHQDVDDLVQNIVLKGSCEQMHMKIAKKLIPTLVKKALPLLACKCTIRPTLDPQGKAWLQYVSLKDDKYAPCLALL
jgi:hypothetical protein